MEAPQGPEATELVGSGPGARIGYPSPSWAAWSGLWRRPVSSAHPSGNPRCLTLPWERPSFKDEVLTVMPEHNPFCPAAQGQGVCCSWGLQWTDAGLGVQCFEEVATAVVRPSFWPGSPWSSCGEATGGTGPASPRPSLQAGRPPWLRAGASRPAPGHWRHASRCARDAGAGRPGRCCTLARGCTAALGSFAKATSDAVSKT